MPWVPPELRTAEATPPPVEGESTWVPPELRAEPLPAATVKESSWVPPEVREDVAGRVRDDLQKGSIFYDLHHEDPYRLDIFTASIKDGKGHQLHRRLFVDTGLQQYRTSNKKQADKKDWLRFKSNMIVSTVVILILVGKRPYLYE